MFRKMSYWLGRLSVGQKLTLIYLLDLTAVIYVSSVLIQEKYIAIDFARKEMVGAAYTEAVRANLQQAFRLAPTQSGDAPEQRKSLQQARDLNDANLHTGEAAERFVSTSEMLAI